MKNFKFGGIPNSWNKLVPMFLILMLLMSTCTLCRLMTGCTSDSADATNENPSKKMIYAPLARQSTEYTCEAACMQSIMRYYGEDVGEEVIQSYIKSDPEIGVDLKLVQEFAESRGYSIEMKEDMSLEELKALIDAGTPVIVVIQAWAGTPVDYENAWDYGHYVIATGYDTEKMYFMDPYVMGNYCYITTSDFLKRWHDTDGHNNDRPLYNFGIIMKKGSPNYNPDTIKELK